MINNPVGPTPFVGDKWAAGIAYIAIPSDIDREEYIANCYLNELVSVWTDDGAFFNRIPISTDVLSFIEFPETFKELGTAVFYVIESIKKQPFIVARYTKDNEISGGREHTFSIRRRIGKNIVEITGSPKNNFLNLIVNAGETKGELNVIVSGEREDSRINVEVAGDIDVYALKSTTVSQGKQLKLITGEEDKIAVYQQANREHLFEGEKIIINKGQEPSVLGNKLRSFLEDFVDEVANITTTTGIGVQPIINKIKISALKAKLNDILSDEVFLNK